MTRLATVVAALVAAWVALVFAIVPEAVRDRWPLGIVALIVTLVAGWVAAGRLVGREQWLLAAGAAVLTLRLPVPTGDGTAMLLAPLYAVIGLGALVLLRRARSEPSTVEARGGASLLLDCAVAGVSLIAGASLLWTVDRIGSLTALAFFFVPFLLAYVIVRAWASRAVSLLPAAWALLASVIVAAGVGLFQAATSQVWWNPKVVDANRFRPDFRTNSLFWDPNIYGRALVVGILLLVAALLADRLPRGRAAAVLSGLAILTTALWNTFSQSSWVALSAALVVVGVLTIPPRPRRWTAALLMVVVVAGTPVAYERLAGADASGRAEVVRAGIELGRERPLLGWGAGSFDHAARERALEQGDYDPRLTASHTTPVTVFAELGLVGMATYLVLLAAAVVAILARWRRSSSPAAAARARGDVDAGTGWPSAAVIWATGAITAIVAHSMLYAGFFEDATLWVALAVLSGRPVAAAAERAATDPH